MKCESLRTKCSTSSRKTTMPTRSSNRRSSTRQRKTGLSPRRIRRRRRRGRMTSKSRSGRTVAIILVMIQVQEVLLVPKLPLRRKEPARSSRTGRSTLAWWVRSEILTRWTVKGRTTTAST